MFRSVQSKHRIKELQKEIMTKEQTIASQQNEIAELQRWKINHSENIPITEKLAE